MDANDNLFTDEQIAVLRAADESLKERPKLTQAKIHEMFNGMPDEHIRQLVNARLKYLSSAAAYELALRGVIYSAGSDN
jgi:hypothetical protein